MAENFGFAQTGAWDSGFLVRHKAGLRAQTELSGLSFGLNRSRETPASLALLRALQPMLSLLAMGEYSLAMGLGFAGLLKASLRNLFANHSSACILCCNRFENDFF